MIHLCKVIEVQSVILWVLWIWPLEQCMYATCYVNSDLCKLSSLETQVVSRVGTALCAVILDLFEILECV